MSAGFTFEFINFEFRENSAAFKLNFGADKSILNRKVGG